MSCAKAGDTVLHANQTAIPVLALNGDFGMDRSRQRPLCCSAETTGAAAEARRSCEMLTSAGNFSPLEG